MREDKGARSTHIGENFPPKFYVLGNKGAKHAHRILNVHGLDNSTGLTALDLPSIPLDLQKISQRHLTMPLWLHYLYTQFPRASEMTEEQYLFKLQGSAEHANHFLRRVLDVPRILVPAPTDIDPYRDNWYEYIKNVKNIYELERIYEALQYINNKSRKIKVSQKTLIRHVSLCAFVKTVAVMYTLNDGRIETREKALEFIDSALKGDLNNVDALIEGGLYKKPDNCFEGTILNSGIKIRYCARLKSIYSSAMKLILNREASIEHALKDVVGIRLEVPQRNIAESIEYLVKYFNDNKTKFNILNINPQSFLRLGIKGNLLSPEEVSLLQQKFPYLMVEHDYQNPKSSGKYRDIKLMFKMLYGNTHVNIEIQVVHKGNRNESGLSNHALYDLKKKVLVMQRLYGAVPSRWFYNSVKHLNRTTGISDKKIVDMFFGTRILKKEGKRIIAPEFYLDGFFAD